MGPDLLRRVRLTVDEAIDLRLLALLLPTSLIASITTRAPEDGRSTLAWFAVNVVTLTLTGLLLVLVRAVLRRRGAATIGVSLVVAIGAGVGLFKGSSTTLLAWAVGLIVDPSVAGEAGRWMSATLQGTVLVPGLALIAATLHRFRSELDRLLLERARRMLLSADAGVRARDARVVRFATEARRRLDAASEPAVARVLEEVVEQRLRPLTRELWRSAEQPTDFSLASLLRAALHAERYSALPVTVVYVLTTFAVRTLYVPIGENLAISVLSAVLVPALYTLAGRVRPVSARWDVAHLLATAATVTLALLAMEVALIGEIARGGINPLVAGTTVGLWLVVLTVLASATRVALRTHDAVRDELERLLAGDLDDAVEVVTRRLRDREVADRLHSSMQNRLIAAARRIDAAGDDGAGVREEVAAVSRLLDDLAAGIAGDPGEGAGGDRGVREHLAELAARWEGFVAVEAAIDPGVDALPAAVQDRLVQAVAEAVNNAVRHGRATRLHVGLTPASAGPVEALQLVVDDDGLGPVQRAPGLGSRLFSTLSEGDWTLTARPDGGSRLEVRVLLT